MSNSLDPTFVFQHPVHDERKNYNRNEPDIKLPNIEFSAGTARGCRGVHRTLGEIFRQVLMAVAAGVLNVGGIDKRARIRLRIDIVDTVTRCTVRHAGIPELRRRAMERLFERTDSIRFQTKLADHFLRCMAIGAGLGDIGSVDARGGVKMLRNIVLTVTARAGR